MFRRKRPVDPRERFVEAAARLLAEVDGVERVERVGDSGLRGHQGGGREPVELHVANLWLEVQDRPIPEQDEVLQRTVHGMQESGDESWDDVAPMVFPAVRSTVWVGNAKGLDHWPLLPFLAEVLVADEPGRLRFLGADHLRDLGVDLDDARERAHRNLREQPLSLVPADGDLAGAFWIAGPEYLQSSWLVLPEVVAQLEQATVGPPLVIAPTFGEVLAVSADDGDAVRRAVEWATATFQEAPRPLSPVPYAAVDGAVVPWTPPASHPARPAVELAVVHLALTEYGEQTRELRDLFERVGEDIFVAEPSGRIDDDGGAFTYAVWPEVITDGMLPEVDRLAMVGVDDEFFLVRWADVMGLAAEWLASEDLSPPRWRVRGWPPPEVVARLRDRAVD